LFKAAIAPLGLSAAKASKPGEAGAGAVEN
jgi:hypothetical protein